MAAIDSSNPRPASGRTNASSSFLRLLLVIGGFVVLLAAVAAVVIYPLWFLATQATDIYTAGFLGLVAALAVLFFLLRWRRAVRNTRLEEFYLKVTRFAVFMLFLLSQLFLTLVHVAWYGFYTSGAPFGVPTVLLHLAGCLTALLSLALPAAALRRNLLGPAGFVVATVLFALQGAYWTAAFVVQRDFPFVALVSLTILSFFFLKKITKIIRKKKNPDDETTDH